MRPGKRQLQPRTIARPALRAKAGGLAVNRRENWPASWGRWAGGREQERQLWTTSPPAAQKEEAADRPREPPAPLRAARAAASRPSPPRPRCPLLDVMCPEGTRRGQDASAHARARLIVGCGGHAVFLQGVQGQGGPTRRNPVSRVRGSRVRGDGSMEGEGGVCRGVGLPRARERRRYIYLLSWWH